MTDQGAQSSWDPRIDRHDDGSVALDLREASLTEASVAMVALIVDARERALVTLQQAEQQAAALVAAATVESDAIRARATAEAASIFESARARIEAEAQAAEARARRAVFPSGET